ncbi:MAG: hypothetical protein ACJAZP_003899 [Psychromonas sp.]|jgi:hypothetical protein
MALRAPLRHIKLSRNRPPSELEQYDLRGIKSLQNSGGRSMEAWNKGKRLGQKKSFKLEDIWRIRIRLELEKSWNS